MRAKDEILLKPKGLNVKRDLYKKEDKDGIDIRIAPGTKNKK